MKVLVADKFEKSGLEGLAAAGFEVQYQPDAKDDALAQAIGASNAEVLVVRSTKVTRPMLEAGRLALVVRAGAGYNTIDVEAASERGIYVANCRARTRLPSRSSLSV
jgi:D-3-phosphoglycerate dehydrogenase